MVNPLQPPWAGRPQVKEYPYVETHDLRTGPDLHPALLGLLPLVGVWRGRGQGAYPAGEDFEFGQEVRFSHDGRPFLYYESRSWVIDEDANPMEPSAREVGWWRPILVDDQPTDELEVMIIHPAGVMELYIGKATGTTRFEMATDAVVRTATARQDTAGHRLYGIVDGALCYAYDLASGGRPLAPHLSARLERIAG